ncbi:MAG: MG2 domain-containing protein [Candidatus Roizmanbacteria bacterium]|nr:MG2 domain-containing protein [Candidatus Roizmanbacteria bacterium]
MKSRRETDFFISYLSTAVVILFLLVFSIGHISLLQSGQTAIQSPTIRSQDLPTSSGPQTLAALAQAPRLSVGGSDEDMGGGVIALSTKSEPTVEIGGYNVSGEATITVYKSSKDALLQYLVHDENNTLLTPQVATSDLEYIGETKKFIQQTNYYDSATEVALPIEGSGVWVLHIVMSGIDEYVYVVRSSIASLVKEGDDELLFWNQDLDSRRSLTNGTVTVYNLRDQVQQVVQGTIMQDGVAHTPLTLGADIAIVESNERFALIPINLRYLNYSYYYNSFAPTQRDAEFYVFTDRPLYQPGDTVYFKAIIREDDDARYSIPSGTARVTLSRGYGEEALFEQTFPITGEGSLYGEVQIPADAKTGSHTVSVDLAPGSDDYNLSGYVYFDVEYFRKPEYSMEVDATTTEYVMGDTDSFTIKGSYFSGQPLAHETVSYKVYASSFYDYTYLSYLPTLSDDYRYSYWYGDVVKEDRVTLDENGIATIALETGLENNTSSRIFSIEAEYTDATGNPVFSRKNILVYGAEFGMFLEDYVTLRSKDAAQIPVVLKPNQNGSVNNVKLSAKVKRTTWISYQEPNKKYPSWREETEELPLIAATTDNSGKAVFNFTPPKEGSYTFTVEAADSRKNKLVKEFSFWAVEEGKPLYRGNYYDSFGRLTIQPDQETYEYTDTVRLQVYSEIPDRDIFVSFDRARVNRYHIISLSGNSTTVELPLTETDIPNISIKASSFSDRTLDTYSSPITVSAEPKKLITKIVADKETYGPGETVTLNVETTDSAGNPTSAETAVWAVDKAIFELVRSNNGDIFSAFWSERYDYTPESHSLLGINVIPAAEMGGGCFAEDTPVLMADGSTKPIKDVHVGDYVLTRPDKDNGELVKARVTQTFEHTVAGYFIINGHLRVTPEHRLWVNESWKEAQYLQSGDVLLDSNNQPVTVETIEWQHGEFSVYNLSIEKYQTYFAGGVWVHNEKGGAPRTTFKDTAYWNPAVQTGMDGRATVRFELPDNLTTWVVTAVGATRDTKVGQGATEVIVGKDVVVRPVLPNVVRVGDDMVISALVQNFTNQERTFDVGFESEDVTINGTTDEQVSIPSRGVTQVYWNISAEQENEEAELTFFAQATDTASLGDRVVQTIPVKQFGFWDRSAMVADGPTEFQVDLDEFADPEKSQIRLTLSATLLGTLPTAMRYLVDYPYGCVEQTTSRFVPAVIAQGNADLFADALEDKDLDKIIQKGIEKLTQQQRPDGGWTWWGSGDSDPFVTAYVAEYLLEAQKQGASVNQQVLSDAESYFTSTPSDLKFEEEIIRAYGKSLFRPANQTSIDGTVLYTVDNRLPSDVIALAVLTNVRNGYTEADLNGLQVLESMAQVQGEGVFWAAGNLTRFGSNDASTALAIRAIVAANGNRDLATKATRYLLRNRTNQYWSNTFATAQVIRAVVEKAKTDEELAPDYSYTVRLNTEVLANGTVSDYRKPIEDIVITPDKLSDGQATISIEKSGDTGNIYSTLLTEEFITNTEAAAESNGISITREYSNDKGKNYSIAVGDTVTVQLTVNGLSTEEQYAVIEDELPAGMIPINPNLVNEQYDYTNTRWYQYGIRSREITLNGIILGLWDIAPNRNTYTYKARVISEGTFQTPPATVSLMYAPEINGRTQADVMTIEKTSQFRPLSGEKGPDFIRTMPYRTIAAAVIGLALVIGVAVFIYRKKRTKKENDIMPPTV